MNGDKEVYSLATTATSTSNVGKYAIEGTALDSNYDITFANKTDSYEITKREVVITVEAKNTIVNTTLPPYTYMADGFVDEYTFVVVPTLPLMQILLLSVSTKLPQAVQMQETITRLSMFLQS